MEDVNKHVRKIHSAFTRKRVQARSALHRARLPNRLSLITFVASRRLNAPSITLEACLRESDQHLDTSFQKRRFYHEMLFEGVCLNSRHPNPRRARKRGSERQLRDHFAGIRWIRWIRWKRWRGKKVVFCSSKTMISMQKKQGIWYGNKSFRST